MRYVMFFTTNDFETNCVDIDREEYDDFEEMMYHFTILSATRDNVLVIEPDAKKVVCHYQSEGKVLFNKMLLDGAIYMNDSE